MGGRGWKRRGEGKKSQFLSTLTCAGSVHTPYRLERGAKSGGVSRGDCYSTCTSRPGPKLKQVNNK